MAYFEQSMPEGAYCVPMQKGFRVSRAFNPIYTTRCPLPVAEFQRIIDELNDCVSSAFPPCLRILPIVLIFTGFILFAIGGFAFVQSAGSNPGAPNPTGPSIIMLGFVLFVGGMASIVCISLCRNRALDKVRRKLSELNARYQSQGVDFDLHSSRHLELYTRHNSDGFNRTGVRTVTDYTLVIQNVLILGDRRVPNSQAMQNYSASAPSAQALMGTQTPVQPAYQNPVYQQPAPVSVAKPVAMTSVVCPPNASPGSTIQIQLPDGGVMNVCVPNGIMPGNEFQVQV